LGQVIVCTDKDAMKLMELDVDLSFVWALEITLELDSEFVAALKQRMSQCGITAAKTQQSDA